MERYSISRVFAISKPGFFWCLRHCISRSKFFLNIPRPWEGILWEGETKWLLFTPTLSLPRRRGRGFDEENFKYLWPGLFVGTSFACVETTEITLFGPNQYVRANI